MRWTSRQTERASWALDQALVGEVRLGAVARAGAL